MKYRITGVATDGSPKNGTIDADSEAEALQKAKAAGISVTSIHPTTAMATAVSHAVVANQPPSDFVLSSGPICDEYTVIGVVVGFASVAEGCSGQIDGEKVYNAAIKRLVETGKSQGASGIMHVSFQNRAATATGCTGPRQVFEVFAWGTAIRY